MTGRTKWDHRGFHERMCITSCLCDHGKPVMQEKEETTPRADSVRSMRRRHLSWKERLRLRLEKEPLDRCLSRRHTSIYDEKGLSPQST